MNKIILTKKLCEKFIKKGFSTKQISKEVNISLSVVKRFLIKNKLKIKHSCKVCNCKFVVNNKSSSQYCSKKCRLNGIRDYSNIEYKNQRNRGLERKKILIKMKGGCCSICGYKKNYSSLSFHHIEPSKKTTQLDIRNLSNKSWKKILLEIEGCQLVCLNCHMEIEHPHLEIDNNSTCSLDNLRVTQVEPLGGVVILNSGLSRT